MAARAENSEGALAQLQADLTGERKALLTIASGVEDQALAWSTRNPGWTVRDVLAHVLASDADLISLLEAAAQSNSRTLAHPSAEQHQEEMARWAEAAPQVFVQHLRQRADRWRELLAAVPGSALTIPVSGAWWPPSALSGGPSDAPESPTGMRALADVLADWRGHDAQHTEDVRLALEDGRSRALA